MGYIALKVSNLENQIAFYQHVLGLQLHWQENHTAGLGAAGEDLIRLFQQPSGKRYPRVTGLYHFALLYPNRRELARAMARLFSLKYPNYPTDHILTKTTYLSDPEGNGIELYAESPGDGTWFIEENNLIARRADGSLSSGREPIDLEALFSHLQKDDKLEAPISPKTRIGHVHLHMSNIHAALDFYHGILGFDVMGVSISMGIAFVSAGGYHHHIGLNTWQGENAPAPPPDAIGLQYFSIVLPSKTELDSVLARIDQAGIPVEEKNEGVLITDPSDNALLLTAQPF